MHPKILPYVYKLTHKETGQFYFGYQEANTVPASESLGKVYFTSSTTVKKIGFDKFHPEILAEFFNGRDAWEFEQELIVEHAKNPLMLNKCRYRKPSEGGLHFRNVGPMSDEAKAKMRASSPKKRAPLSESTKEKLSAALKGRKFSDNAKAKMSASAKITVRDKHTEETRAKISQTKTGKKLSEDKKANLYDKWIIVYEDGRPDVITDRLGEWCKMNAINYSSLKNTLFTQRRNPFHKGIRLCKFQLNINT